MCVLLERMRKLRVLWVKSLKQVVQRDVAHKQAMYLVADWLKGGCRITEEDVLFLKFSKKVMKTLAGGGGCFLIWEA